MGFSFSKTASLQADTTVETNSAAIHKQFRKSSNIDVYRIVKPLSKEEKLNLSTLFKLSNALNIKLSFRSLYDLSKWLTYRKYKDLSLDECRLKYISLCRAIKDRELFVEIEDSINPINFRNGDVEYRRLKLKPHQVKATVHQGFTSLFPDQIPKDVLIDYFRNTRERYLSVRKGKIYLDYLGERKQCRISDNDFMSVISNTLYGKAIYSFDELDSTAIKHYMKLFGISTTDKYLLIDVTVVRAMPIRKEDNVWLAPSVVLLKKKDIQNGCKTTSLTVVSIAIENLNHIDEKELNVTFPDTLNNLNIVRPTEGLTWEMAKLHVLQSLCYVFSLGEHGHLHFTLANPIGMTSLATRNDDLSKSSIISKILLDHTYLQVPTDSYVIHFKASVLTLENAPYYGWNSRNGGPYKLIQCILNGWENHPIYKTRNMFIVRDHLGSKYCDFVNRIKYLVMEWVEKWFDLVCTDPNEIQFMRDYKTKLWEILPIDSFLRKPYENIRADSDYVELFKKLVAFIIYNGIEHSLDHSSLEGNSHKGEGVL
jgi:hypothetical protein